MKYGVIENVFTECLIRYLYYLYIEKKQVSAMNILKCIHLAYAECLDKEILPNSWIVWQQHNFFTSSSLAEVEKYEKFMFLTTVRNPVKSLDSHLSHCYFMEKKFETGDGFLEIFSWFWLHWKEKRVDSSILCQV